MATDPTMNKASEGFVQQQPMTTTHVAAAPAPGTGRPWQNGLFDCFSPGDLCCMGYWCPCILFGKTQQRVRNPVATQFETFNGECIGWLALTYCGCQWVFQMMKRTEMRERYGLEGSGFKDCLISCCCGCCALIQEEKEAVAQNSGHAAGPPQGYQANNGMQYPPA